MPLQHRSSSPLSMHMPNRPMQSETPPKSMSLAGSSSSSQANNNNGPRRRRTRCKKCEACNRSDCGECNFCLDMVKFGGPGRAKQTCVMRQCLQVRKLPGLIWTDFSWVRNYMIKYLQPMLPVTASCAVCKLDGWGLEPVVPIQKTAERASCPSSLMECSVCFEIMHPKCAISRLAPEARNDGQVNEDMPNSWECPICCKDGKNQDYKVG